MKSVLIIAIAFVLILPLSVHGLTPSEVERKLSQAQSEDEINQIMQEIVESSEYQRACRELFSNLEKYQDILENINLATKSDIEKVADIGKDFISLQCQFTTDYWLDKEGICGTGTVFSNGQCIPDVNSKKSLGGGCLIATATYGSELAPQVQQLRELRDNKLLNTESGTSFINSFNDFYYSFSPYIADYERENPVFKEAVKIAITPMISSLSILNYVDMDSEIEVLGYGISLIILNVGMYVGIPILAIMRLRK